MLRIIKGPTTALRGYSIWSVIHFFLCQKVQLGKMNCQICEVYGDNAASGYHGQELNKNVK